MSSLTVGQVVERVYYRAAGVQSEAQARLYRFEIAAWINEALDHVADKAADSDDHAIIEKTFSINLTAGVGTLDGAMIVRTIHKWGRVTGSGLSYALQYLPHLQDLELPRSTEFQYYALEGNSIHCRQGDTTASALASVSVICGYYPAISAGYTANTVLTDLPAQLDDMVIDELVMMAKEKMGRA